MKTDFPDILLTFLIATMLFFAAIYNFKNADKAVERYAEEVIRR